MFIRTTWSPSPPRILQPGSGFDARVLFVGVPVAAAADPEFPRGTAIYSSKWHQILILKIFLFVTPCPSRRAYLIL